MSSDARTRAEIQHSTKFKARTLSQSGGGGNTGRGNVPPAPSNRRSGEPVIIFGPELDAVEVVIILRFHIEELKKECLNLLISL